MKYFSNALLLLTAAAFITGCSADEQKKGLGPHYLLYSPNAEPLNGGVLDHPSCDTALSGWFERNDANYDSLVDKTEFMADAKAQFARMDIDKQGYLVSEELERYREPYWQGLTWKADHNGEEKKKSYHGKEDSQGKHERNTDTDQTTLIDPVMSADSNLDFKVTPEEFFAQAEKNFADLDADHNGLLSRDEVLAICKKSDSK